MDIQAETLHKAAAWKFIILLGVVSLFSDMTHEGASAWECRALSCGPP